MTLNFLPVMNCRKYSPKWPALFIYVIRMSHVFRDRLKILKIMLESFENVMYKGKH